MSADFDLYLGLRMARECKVRQGKFVDLSHQILSRLLCAFAQLSKIDRRSQAGGKAPEMKKNVDAKTSTS